jgi:ectoine hydroxylase-related dioxygenase (phytanoyl-CoA dioxygenase family)
VRSGDYWRGLAPHLSLGAAGRVEAAAAAIPAAPLDAAAADVRRRGYFQLDGVVPPHTIQNLRRAVEVLAAAGWPVVFSFVYDEFWAITRSAPVLGLVRRVLGEDCVQLEGIWTHYVKPVRGSHGWAPHVDSTGYRNGPGGLGVWFALSEATLDNGCMHVIPSDLVAEQTAAEFSTISSFTARETRHLLQSARALPARAGTMMGWDFNVIHWGGTCHDATEPRISTAMEFASREQADAQPQNEVIELNGPLPALEVRLRVIAKALLSYTRFEALLAPYEPLAKALLSQ